MSIDGIRKTKAAQIEQLQSRIRQLQTDRNLKIGLFGIPNAGKTSLLISWYLFRSDPRFLLNLRFDEQTMLYLRDAAEHLLTKGSTYPTSHVTPEKLKFRLTEVDSRREFDVETLDYAGHFVEPGDPNAPTRTLAVEARQFLQQCDAILCLIDSTHIRYTILDAIDTSLRAQRPYLILVLTKFDEIGPLPETSCALRPVYEQLEKGTPLLQNVRQQIRAKRLNDDFFIVPVSALQGVFCQGELTKSLPLERDDLHPWNIYTPLREALKGKERKVKREVSALTNKIGQLQTELADAEKQEATSAARQRKCMEEKAARNAAQKQEIEDRLSEKLAQIDGEVQEAMHSYALDFFFLPAKWLFDLEQLKTQANSAGLAGIAGKAQELASAIRRRRTFTWVVAVSVSVVVVVVVSVWLATKIL